MHKDKGNGIVMMLKFASTFFSITLLGVSYLCDVSFPFEIAFLHETTYNLNNTRPFSRAVF